MTAEMADILVQRPATTRVGVFPLIDQVLWILGMRENPLSSRKAKRAPSRSAFFYMRPNVVFPVANRFFPALLGPFLRLLTAPSQAIHQIPKISCAIAHPKALLDYLTDTFQGPKIGRVPGVQRAFHQDAHQSFLLMLRQARGSPRIRSRFQSSTTFLPVGLVPAHHGA